jgi:hypothetical protein
MRLAFLEDLCMRSFLLALSVGRMVPIFAFAQNSRPPADAIVVELARNRPDLLPLTFHVTYWNNLGWQDPFSFAGATERQRRYVALSRCA